MTRRTTLTLGAAEQRQLQRYVPSTAHDAYRGALEQWLTERDRDPSTLTTEAAVIRALLAVADEALTELAFERGYAQMDAWYAENPVVEAEEDAERTARRARRGQRDAAEPHRGEPAA